MVSPAIPLHNQLKIITSEHTRQDPNHNRLPLTSLWFLKVWKATKVTFCSEWGWMALCVSVSGLSTQRSLWGRLTKGTVNNNSTKNTLMLFYFAAWNSIKCHILACSSLNTSAWGNFSKCFRLFYCVDLLTSTLHNAQVDQHHFFFHCLLMWKSQNRITI